MERNEDDKFSRYRLKSYILSAVRWLTDYKPRCSMEMRREGRVEALRHRGTVSRIIGLAPRKGRTKA